MSLPPFFPPLARRAFSGYDLRVTKAHGLALIEQALRNPASPDAALLAACRELIEVDDRREKLIEAGIGRTIDERQLAMLDEQVASLLRTATGLRPSTLQGHQARAAAFLATDGDVVATRANKSDRHEARMLAALVFDLLEADF